MQGYLDGRKIDVWPVRLTAPDVIVARFRQILAPAETARATRFRFNHLQRSFMLSRGVLRVLLGYYLGAAPGGIEFSYGPKGKPRLAAPVDVRFNVSHSGGLALFAFTLDCEIGVDVEHIRPLRDMREIASRFFCAEEATELISLPAHDREQAFYLCWTRKEAYLKAIGEGLSEPLDGFRVTLRPGEAARFIHLGDDAAATKAWTLHNLELPSQYAGALAYKDVPRPVRMLPLVEAAELVDLA